MPPSCQFLPFCPEESRQGLLYLPRVWQIGTSNTDEVESLTARLRRLSLPRPLSFQMCSSSQSSWVAQDRWLSLALHDRPISFNLMIPPSKGTQRPSPSCHHPTPPHSHCHGSQVLALGNLWRCCLLTLSSGRPVLHQLRRPLGHPRAASAPHQHGIKPKLRPTQPAPPWPLCASPSPHSSSAVLPHQGPPATGQPSPTPCPSLLCFFHLYVIPPISR